MRSTKPREPQRFVAFPIPMRGNEAKKYGLTNDQVRKVSDPHEG